MKLDIYLNPEGNGCSVHIIEERIEEAYKKKERTITLVSHRLNHESASLLHPLIGKISGAQNSGEVLMALQAIKAEVDELPAEVIEASQNTMGLNKAIFYYNKDNRPERVENFLMKNVVIPVDAMTIDQIYLCIKYSSPPNDGRHYYPNILDEMIQFLTPPSCCVIM